MHYVRFSQFYWHFEILNRLMGYLKNFFAFHHMDNYNFTKFHQNQMKNKKKVLVNSPFFCWEFQSVSRIVKIVHSACVIVSSCVILIQHDTFGQSTWIWVGSWQFGFGRKYEVRKVGHNHKGTRNILEVLKKVRTSIQYYFEFITY